MTAAELRRRRSAAQLLAGSPRLDPPGGVRRLLAVQSQDLRAARLALRARGAAAAAGEVDAALTEDRSLVVAWLMRGTLHLVAREDYGWLHALTAPLSVATSRRRLAQLGGDADKGVPRIVQALTEDGPLTRTAIGERLAAAGIRTEGQILPHLLGLAAAEGSAVLGPVRDGTQSFALRRDWLGPARAAPARDAALAELARRYLRGHGPATAADLAAWSGLGLRDARSGLDAIAGELRQFGDLIDIGGREAPPARLPVRLLGAFDPYLLGWKDRTFAVAAGQARVVHPGGGIVRPAAIANGRAVGTWTAPGGRVTIDPFGPLPPTVEAALRREAARVARF
jgi:Winged helix DNA-binding domain